MKMNKLLTLAVTLLLSSVTVVSCGNRNSSAGISSSEPSSVEPSSTNKDSTSSSNSTSSSKDTTAELNYGTKDAPIDVADAAALLNFDITTPGESSYSSKPLFVKAYVVAVEDGKYYLDTTAGSTSKQFVVSGATIATGVNTPSVGNQVTVTGYAVRYSADGEMVYEIKTKDTVVPSIIWSDAKEAVNYGTKEAPLTIAEAKMLCDAAGDNTISTNQLFVKGYVKTISYDSNYKNYTIWLSSTSTGEKEFELYACSIADGVVTPIEGSQVIATGYYEKYVKDSTTTYELTHTKIGDTRVYPSVVWSDAVKPTIPEAETIGSLEAPKTVAEAYTVIGDLEASTYTAKVYSAAKYYVKGIVKTVTVKDDTYTVDIADSATSTDVLNVYYASLATDVTAPKIGDEVIAIGHLINFVGKYEMAGDGTNYVNTIIEKVTAGTATYAIETSIVDSSDAASTNATITGLPTEAVLPNTELSFQVTAAENYRVASVTFNGTTLVADDEGNYKATSYLENKIVVTVVEDVDYEDTTVTYSIATVATANSWKNQSQYTTLPTGDDNLSITAQGGSNTGKYYNSANDWRIYQTESGKVIFSVTGSHVIKSVTLTYKSGNNGIAVYNGNQYESGTTITAVGSTSTMEIGVSQSTATTKANGNIQIYSIVVVYA